MRQKKREVLLSQSQWYVVAPVFLEVRRRKDGMFAKTSSPRSSSFDRDEPVHIDRHDDVDRRQCASRFRCWDLSQLTDAFGRMLAQVSHDFQRRRAGSSE